MIYKQINYSTTGYVGIDPRNVLVTYLNTNELRKSFEAMRSELEKIPGVIRTAGGSYIPPFGNFLPINLANPEGEKERFDGLIMGEGMVELLGIEVIDGTSFGPFGNGPISVILNESSAIKHNVKAGDNFLSFHVLGIVRDFHAHSLHSLIQPMVILQQNPASMALLAVKTSGQNDKAVIDKLRELYATIAPDEFFEATYLTDVVEGFYTRERNLARIVLVFSILAAILSVMGLFGISLIGISRKKKQIGIRKVNGASTPGLMLMLNFGFIKWVFAAMLISVPLAVYLLNEWIERFAYRTELSWWVFAAGCLSACLIAIITISWHSWKASTRNPVEALRYE
jgi:putative ABC transport system permease protein